MDKNQHLFVREIKLARPYTICSSRRIYFKELRDYTSQLNFFSIQIIETAKYGGNTQVNRSLKMFTFFAYFLSHCYCYCYGFRDFAILDTIWHFGCSRVVWILAEYETQKGLGAFRPTAL